MINIKKPKEVKKLITCVNSFNPDVQLKINESGCHIALITEINARMRLLFKTNLITSDKEIKLNIKEIQRLKQAIQLVEDTGVEDIKFNVSSDVTNISYSAKGLKFKLHMVDEIAIAKNIDNKAFPELTQLFSFTAEIEKIKYLFKQSSMVRSDSIKIYLVNESGTIISAQLEDKTTKHSGIVAIPLTDSFNGVFEPLALSTASIKSLVILPGEKLDFIATTSKAVLVQSKLVFEDADFIESQILFAPVQ